MPRLEIANLSFRSVMEREKSRNSLMPLRKGKPSRCSFAEGCLVESSSQIPDGAVMEAGVTFVTARITGWDNHGKIEAAMKNNGVRYDQAVASLVTDLADRGLDRDVLVVSMGEFGRTPRINKNAGRDHWGKLMSVLVAGGGLRMGQVIGESNSRGEEPTDAPYRPENVLAMVYRHLGIDPASTIKDFSGRPRFLLEEKRLIKELI